MKSIKEFEEHASRVTGDATSGLSMDGLILSIGQLTKERRTVWRLSVSRAAGRAHRNSVLWNGPSTTGHLRWTASGRELWPRVVVAQAINGRLVFLRGDWHAEIVARPTPIDWRGPEKGARRC